MTCLWNALACIYIFVQPQMHLFVARLLQIFFWDSLNGDFTYFIDLFIVIVASFDFFLLLISVFSLTYAVFEVIIYVVFLHKCIF